MLTVRPEDAVDGMAPVGPHISKAAPTRKGPCGCGRMLPPTGWPVQNHARHGRVMDMALLPCCFHIAALAQDKEMAFDPMLVEVAAFSMGHRSLPSLDPPTVNSQLSAEVAPTPGCSEGPVLETVMFELPTVVEGDATPWSPVGDAQPRELVDGALPLSSLVADLVPQPLFVNMSRGSLPDGMQKGVIPTSLETFGRIMTKPMPLSITAMPTPSTRWWC
jgi:hypothetical protein